MCQDDDEKEELIRGAEIAAGYTSQEKGPKTPRKKGPSKRKN
jgi:hypothetical protein